MPRNIAPVLSSISSRSIGLAWDRIECSESNGIVFYYIADIQRQSEARSPAVTMDQNFTAAGLTPNTVYTFRVAGVNINGTGPFSDAITILTAEDSKTCFNFLTHHKWIQGWGWVAGNEVFLHHPRLVQ